jgi:hypothetical protein
MKGRFCVAAVRRKIYVVGLVVVVHSTVHPDLQTSRPALLFVGTYERYSVTAKHGNMKCIAASHFGYCVTILMQ